MRPLRRRPAVSTSTYGRPSTVTSVSTASRVVPGTESTTTRSCPAIAFTSEDFPTFGRPTTQSRIGPASSSSSAAPSEGAGSRIDNASISSATPRPCSAETSRTGSIPRP